MEAMFELDMALSMLTTEENDVRTKLSEKKAFNENQLGEMPLVIGVAGECAVCMEVFESDVGGKQVPCGHVFHSGCISKWLSDHNTCPLCRSTVFSTGDGKEKHQPNN